MATPYRNVGSIESSDALASTTGDGAYMDYDSGSGYARFGAKGGAGTSLGTKIRTVLAGVLKDAITIAASGLTITLLAGSTLAAQAVTATGSTASAGVVTSSGSVAGNLYAFLANNTSSSALASTQYRLLNDSSGVAALLLYSSGTATSLYTGANNTAVITAGGSLNLVTSDANPIRFWVNNSTLAGTISSTGAWTIASGLAVSAGGIMVSAGTSAFQAVTMTGANNVVALSGAGTSRQYITLISTGANALLGVGASSGGSLFTGDTAYSTILGTGNATSLWLGVNGVVRFGISGGDIANSSVGNFLLIDSAAPTGNPSSGGFLFSQSGALKWRGSSGTVTTIAAA